MNIQETYRAGIVSGLETAEYGDFTDDEKSDIDKFLEAGFEILYNKRQYADSPTYEIAKQKNSESLFDAFDRGEMIGLQKGFKKFHNKIF